MGHFYGFTATMNLPEMQASMNPYELQTFSFCHP